MQNKRIKEVALLSYILSGVILTSTFCQITDNHVKAPVTAYSVDLSLKVPKLPIITDSVLLKIKEQEQAQRQKEIDSKQQESMGVLRKSPYTAQQLEKGLLKNMKPLAGALKEAENQTGIDAVFLAAVASLESGHGTSAVAAKYNNLFGWTSKNGYKSFGSKEQCIAEVANSIKKNYLTPGAIYFTGYEIEDVNKYYNGSQFWVNQVKQIYSEIVYRIEKR